MKITTWLYTHPLKFSLIISLCLFIFFASSVPSFNVGYADSDEFLTTAYHWGIAHPPGYSLYTLVLHTAMNLPLPFTTPAFRAHLISALCVALGLGLSIPLQRMIFTKLWPKRQQTAAIFLFSSLVTTISVATAKQLWLYAQITEKYVFAAPFISLMLLIGFKLITLPNSKVYLYGLFSLLYGLLLTHHQSFIFLLPAFIYTLVQSLKLHKTYLPKIAISLIGLILGILLPISLLWIQLQTQATKPVSWFSGNSLNGLVNLLTRADFKGTVYSKGITTNGYLPQDITLSRLVTCFFVYLKYLGQSFNWWIYLPITIGLVNLAYRAKKTFFWFFGLGLIFFGPILTAYLGWPTDLASQAITERFFLINYFFLLPVIFIGMVELIRRLLAGLTTAGLHSKYIPVFLSLLPLILIIQTVLLYPSISLKSFDLVSRLYHSVLTEVKPNSIVTCFSDSSCFALLYEQTVNQLRPDVTIVPLAYPLVNNQLTAQNLHSFTYTDNPFLMVDIITSNLDKRPVYAVDLNQYYFSLLGLNNAFMYYLPDGYKAELSRTMPEFLPSYNYQITSDYLTKSFPKFDKYRLHLVESLVQTHISNSFTYLKRGERALAQQELNTAVTLSYRLSKTQSQNTQASRANLESILTDPRFAKNSRVISPKVLMDQVPGYYQRNQNSYALNAVRGALILDPYYLPARIELARIYQKMGDVKFTQMEYRHVLMLDPNNQEALSQLAQ